MADNSEAFKEALYGALMAATDGPVRRSYNATGWHAQISKLTSSARGYWAAEKAGLSVSEKTLRKWLAEEQDPKPANMALIARAYSIMRGEWPAGVRGKTIVVDGDVTIDTDTRDRKFRIYSEPRDSTWDELQARWEEGTVDADWLGNEWIYELIENDIGEMSDPPEFNGSSYTVTFE